MSKILRRPAAAMFAMCLVAATTGCALPPGGGGLTGAPASARALFKPSPAAMRAHMSFLADDSLEGRRPGTQGYEVAARYVASQFERHGLRPAGDDGSYIQKVPLVQFRTTGKPTLSLRNARGRVTKLKLGTDFQFYGSPLRAKIDLTAPLIFAGYGIVVPSLGRDDYNELDLAGKIVIVLENAPPAMTEQERNHYGASSLKREEAGRRGAVGMIFVTSLDADSSPPAAPSSKPAAPRPWKTTWRSKTGAAWVRGERVIPVARVDRSGAAKLFADAPVTLDAIRAASRTGDGKMAGFALPSVVTASLRTEIKDIASSNVAGFVRGSDPAVSGETIVLSAHLDHLGVDPLAKGDSISNGALDNSAGVSTLLEVARAITEAPDPPRRSILLLALTAEELGLVGADYFVHNPTVPKAAMVANVNLDMPILTYDFTDVVALGSERSSIGAAVERAGRRLGIAIAPAPQALTGDFTRSDHYRFVEAGVPSVFLRTGFANGGEAAFNVFLERCYHRPCDDLFLSIDYQAAARFANLNYEIVRELADASERPHWKAGDFYGEQFKQLGR